MYEQSNCDLNAQTKPKEKHFTRPSSVYDKKLDSYSFLMPSLIHLGSTNNQIDQINQSSKTLTRPTSLLVNSILPNKNSNANLNLNQFPTISDINHNLHLITNDLKDSPLLGQYGRLLVMNTSTPTINQEKSIDYANNQSSTVQTPATPV